MLRLMMMKANNVNTCFQKTDQESNQKERLIALSPDYLESVVDKITKGVSKLCFN